ncbi:hypothetical protein P3T43_006959 [Paraburkholderia sp. GAS41]
MMESHAGGAVPRPTTELQVRVSRSGQVSALYRNVMIAGEQTRIGRR